MCEVLLRSGVYKFYTYDIKEDHRNDDTKMNASKELVREFTYEKTYEPHDENLCSKCINWRDDRIHKCFTCEKEFLNTDTNYRLNGNICETCALKFEILTDSIHNQQYE